MYRSGRKTALFERSFIFPSVTIAVLDNLFESLGENIFEKKKKPEMVLNNKYLMHGTKKYIYLYVRIYIKIYKDDTYALQRRCKIAKGRQVEVRGRRQHGANGKADARETRIQNKKKKKMQKELTFVSIEPLINSLDALTLCFKCA